jgi:hypothetical protein
MGNPWQTIGKHSFNGKFMENHRKLLDNMDNFMGNSWKCVETYRKEIKEI